MIWSDKKCHLGMRISCTEYSLDDTHLIVREGVLGKREEQTNLYRIVDISVKQSLIDRICKQGTLVIRSSDPSTQEFEIKNIKNFSDVKNKLNKAIDNSRRRNVTTREFVNTEFDDLD